MKYIKQSFLALVFFGGVILAPATVSAHAIIPPEIIEYMESNPDASVEEIESLLNQRDDWMVNEGNEVYVRQMIESVRNEVRGFWPNALNFIRLGIMHILSGPDHILFVLAIALTFTRLWGLLKLVTTFTVAHSTTLIIAGLGLFTLTSNFVEPMIALSIAWVAMTSVFYSHDEWLGGMHGKIPTVFFFGLFHGLGFAGVLTELSIPYNKFISSLLFFNVGVEIGQLCILAITIPLLLWIRKKTWHNAFIKVTALSISALAMVWFFQRIMAT